MDRMQQIAMLCHVARRYRINISRRMIGLFLLYSLLIDSCCARGPHHPRSDIKKRAAQQQHINEHLGLDAQHIQDDLNEMKEQLPTEKKVEEMTEDERNYLYFKAHDLDGNDKLDGLEMFYSATHHAAEHEHDHEHTEASGTNEATEMPESDTNQPSNDSNSNSDILNLNHVQMDENGQILNKNVNHIIDELDDFLSLADLNNDGYLNYAEFTSATKLGSAMIDEQNSEL